VDPVENGPTQESRDGVPTQRESADPVLDAQGAHRAAPSASPEAPTPTPPPRRRSFFRDVPWRWGDVAVGLAPVVTWRLAVAFVDPAWLSAAGPWLGLPLAFLGTCWLLAYPLWVARRRRGAWPPLPRLRSLAVEAALAVPMLLALWAILLIVFIVWILLFGEGGLPTNTLQPPDRSRDPTGVIAWVLLLVAVAPLAEEVFCRGLLYSAFRQRLPLAVAVLAQAVIFGLLHTFGLAHAVVAVLIGLVLAVAYEWRKTLLAPVLVHALQNTAAVAVALWATEAAANAPLLGVHGRAHEGGFLVVQVVPDSAAEEAGLRAGDVIAVVDGIPVADFQGLVAAVRARNVGDRILVEFVRGGQRWQVGAILKGRRKG
jgi:membrane protease YdiL (CAAX protease family)